MPRWVNHPPDLPGQSLPAAGSRQTELPKAWEERLS